MTSGRGLCGAKPMYCHRRRARNVDASAARENMRRYGVTANDVSWDMIKLAAQSKANLMITPFQDVLCLGREARQPARVSWRP